MTSRGLIVTIAFVAMIAVRPLVVDFYFIATHQ